MVAVLGEDFRCSDHRVRSPGCGMPNSALAADHDRQPNRRAEEHWGERRVARRAVFRTLNHEQMVAVAKRAAAEKSRYCLDR